MPAPPTAQHARNGTQPTPVAMSTEPAQSRRDLRSWWSQFKGRAAPKPEDQKGEYPFLGRVHQQIVEATRAQQCKSSLIHASPCPRDLGSPRQRDQIHAFANPIYPQKPRMMAYSACHCSRVYAMRTLRSHYTMPRARAISTDTFLS